MNTNDVVELSRSGALFCAMPTESMKKLHIMRRLLAVDCPNTTTNTHDDYDVDEGLARCTNEDALVQALYRFIKAGSQFHTQFVEDPRGSPNVQFTTIVDTFLQRRHVLDSKERPAPRNSRLLPTPFGEYGQDTPCRTPAKLRVATGTALKSIAIVDGRISSSIPHRCSIQVLSLPSVDPDAVDAIQAKSPARLNLTTPIKAAAVVGDSPSVLSPDAHAPTSVDGSFTIASPTSPSVASDANRSKSMVNTHEEVKHFVPHCGFGLHCPSMPSEQRVSQSLQSKAPYVSSRWVGFYWMAGSSIPQIAILAGITVEGMPRVLHMKGTRIVKEDDILTIETVPHPHNQVHPWETNKTEKAPSCDIVFSINGEELQRIESSHFMPTSLHLEDCYFAAQLSTNSSVALLNGDIPRQ